MIRIEDILARVRVDNSDINTSLIEQAYIYSAKVHGGQERLLGEPYLSHPLEVALILADMNLDGVCLAAALLHDVIEDTHASEDEIEELFGSEVRHIVTGVTKITEIPKERALMRQAESLRKMILAMANDIRVILIKLADRVHNMRTIKYQNPDKIRYISQETLDIFAPIASRLGLYKIKKELEDRAFQHLQPQEYEHIKKLVLRDQIKCEEYIAMVSSQISNIMEKEGLSCLIKGRRKHLYSIYRKMITQNLPFEMIYDIRAFRIILNSKEECYKALGLLHNLWKPVDAKFKDYIGKPKPNMYRSLHTTVIGPGGCIEIQIRTHTMDKVAKSGIAAHWSYKEGLKVDAKVRNMIAWIQELVNNQKNVKDPNELLENMRLDLFPDEVLVFTPQGDIKSLPRDATPVDFAYQIHTDIGHQCMRAKINGCLVSLKQKLKSGDMVEIITTQGHVPSRNWLESVKTVKARSRIRQWIKVQEKERSISLGREMCEKAFRKANLNYSTIIKSEMMPEVIKSFGLTSLEDLIANVGYGKITPRQLVNWFQSQNDNQSILQKLMRRSSQFLKPDKKASSVMVKGLDDVLVRFGKCCRPVPGDSVCGYITRGYGVTVHKTNCKNADKQNPEREIEVEWSSTSEDFYPVKIMVCSYDRKGLLADIIKNMSKHKINILEADSKSGNDKMIYSHFTIAVKNITKLNTLLTDIRKVKLVHDVKRIGC